MTNPDIKAKITTTIKKLPTWVRRDLNALDTSLRERAEESLAAMITAALEKEGAEGTKSRR